MPEQPSADEQARAPLFPKMEEEMVAYWKKHRIFERSLEERSAGKSYVFYDGPPFATGLPHFGHMLQSTIKDVVPRYWTMKGFRVPRRWGWDCHGLPIENLIEKQLALATKKDIEAYSIEKFNSACSLSVLTYVKDWGKYIDRLGRWVDFENAYKTMDTDYTESVWWVFSELHNKGYVYKGVRVSLYCPRCETPLSNFEIAMGNSYVDKEDPAVYVRFPVKDREKTFFLAWTTTPWTLPANTGLAVHPDLIYVAAKIEKTGETLIFAEPRQSDILKEFYPLQDDEGSGFQITDRWKGSELAGMRYEPLYKFLPVEGDGFKVVTGAHVTADDGTGIVHTAPAFGEEDFQMMKEHELPMVQTVDDSGRLIEACGPFGGLKVQEANAPIMDDLEARGLLYRRETVTHSVPVCWRCNTHLLHKAQPAWFVDVTKLKPKMLKAAEKIHWHPEHFKEGRFGKGLDSAPDWNISRTRYWGASIPVWECKDCHKQTIIGSVAELKAKAKPGTLSDVVDLHRPSIDHVVFACPCGGEQKRIPEVFDCWFESGSMPYASQHYPFENKKAFEKNFPADFIAEGQDQTRGWFYSLHVLASALFQKPAFKDVIVTGLILAESGKKLSKSQKNFADPLEVIEKYGADALRFYLLSSPVVEAESLSFSEHDLQNVMRGFVNLLWNVKVFYSTYATETVRLSKPRSAHVLDRWLYARFMAMLKEVSGCMDHYELARAARPMRAFVDELSTWWLRRSRDRLKSENEYERMDALKTLREVLEETVKVFAPFIPFITDKIYLDIGGQKASVHLETWPKVDQRLLDEKLMADMEWVRGVCSKAHEARAAAKIPVRQALGTLHVRFAKAEEADRLKHQSDLLAIIREEVNVEQVELASKAGMEESWEIELDTVITPELKQKGIRREFMRHVMNLRKKNGLQPSDRVRVSYATESEEVRRALEAEQELVARELRATELKRADGLGENAEEVNIAGAACRIVMAKE